MGKKAKVLYRGIAWIFLSVIATGTFSGCNMPGATKYGVPPANSSSYEQNKIKDTQKDVKL